MDEVRRIVAAGDVLLAARLSHRSSRLIQNQVFSIGTKSLAGFPFTRKNNVRLSALGIRSRNHEVDSIASLLNSPHHIADPDYYAPYK
jgi:hypothetical protein